VDDGIAGAVSGALKRPPASAGFARSLTMSRIRPVVRDTSNDAVRRNFDLIQKRLGMVPNMMRTIAH
jgi:hypothetical protein